MTEQPQHYAVEETIDGKKVTRWEDIDNTLEAKTENGKTHHENKANDL